MENKKSGLTVVLVIIIAVLCLVIGSLLGSKNSIGTDKKENNNEVVNKEEINKEENNNKITYEVGEIKNIHDVISDGDTNFQKAQKIAKELMDAVNNKDWYYLAKMVGSDADYFIKYGIYNYNVDVNNYGDRDGIEFAFFDATIDWDKTKLNSLEDEGLGRMLVITFEDGGRIRITPFATGF